MEFREKLQQLRKDRGLTQEELTDLLYVSRTAVSKWESGRGYPNIDSLKEISKFFSVTIDELLSGERLLSIAEEDKKSGMKNLCSLLFGIVDLFSLMLVVLPLYPDNTADFVYSVTLFNYTQCTKLNLIILWSICVLLVAIGIINVILSANKSVRGTNIVLIASIAINSFAIVFLALSAETYAVVVAFSLLFIKGIIFLKDKSCN